LIQPGDLSRPIRILDVGGTAAFWKSNWNLECDNLIVTLLNLEHTDDNVDLPVTSHVGDARDMPQYPDQHFDFCFSNSVIEHAGSLYEQKRMAQEIRRVARGYFIQTPYRYFPIEPQYHFPGWAQLPYWVRTMLHQRMDLGWVKAEQDYLDARIRIESCRLLSIREMRLLFPEAQIEYERFGPLIKSLIATRPARLTRLQNSPVRESVLA